VFVPCVPVVLTAFHACPGGPWTEFRTQHAALTPGGEKRGEVRGGDERRGEKVR
jgi:hypothetical protein